MGRGAWFQGCSWSWERLDTRSCAWAGSTQGGGDGGSARQLPGLCGLGSPQKSSAASRWPSGLTLLWWPLTRRVLVPSAQLTYQSVPAVVPTTPMSMLSWKTALTTAPSRVNSRSINTELDLAEQGVKGVAAARAEGARWFGPRALALPEHVPWGMGPAGNRVPAPRHTVDAHLAPEPLRLSSGTAPTAHRRSRLVLLPLTRRAPEHSSTPGGQEMP